MRVNPAETSRPLNRMPFDTNVVVSPDDRRHNARYVFPLCLTLSALALNFYIKEESWSWTIWIVLAMSMVLVFVAMIDSEDFSNFYHSSFSTAIKRDMKRLFKLFMGVYMPSKKVQNVTFKILIESTFFFISLCLKERDKIMWMASLWLNSLAYIVVYFHPGVITLLFVLSISVWTSYMVVCEYLLAQKRRVSNSVRSLGTKIVTAFQLLRGADGKLDFMVNAALIYNLFAENELQWLKKALDFVDKASKEKEEEFEAASAMPTFETFSSSVMDFDEFTEKWAKWKHIPKSNVYKSLKRFGAYMFAMGLTETLGVKFNESVFSAHMAKHGETLMTKQDPEFLLMDIVDTTITFVKTCRGLFIGQSLEEVLEHQDEILKFFTDYENLMERFEARRENDTDLLELAGEFKKMCQFGRRLKAGVLSSRVTPILKSLEETHRSLLVKVANSGSRKLPFGVLLYGPSGVGKSSITDMILQMYLKYSKEYGYNTDIPEWKSSRDKYARQFVDKYWSEYDGQWAVVLDDVAQEKASRLATKESSSVHEIIMIMNNIPFATTQAEITKKGSTPLLARAVVATTNVKDLNAHAVFAVPSAVRRRFPLVVTVAVKPEFRKPGTEQLCETTKLSPHTNSWDFIVEEVTVENNVAQYTPVHKTPTVDMRGLQDIIKDYVVRHETAQENLMNRMNVPLEFRECGHLKGTCNCGQKYLAASDLSEFVEPSVYKWRARLLWLFGSYKKSAESYIASIDKSRMLTLITGIIAALLVLQLFIAKQKPLEPEAFEAAMGSTQGKSVWVKESDDILAHVQQQSRTVLPNQLQNILDRNIFTIEVVSGKEKRVQRAFGVKGRTVVTNWHLFKQMEGDVFDITLYSGKRDQPIKDKACFSIRRDELIAHDTKDLVFITHPDIREVKDLKSFMAPQIPQKFSGMYFTRDAAWHTISKGTATQMKFVSPQKDCDLGDRAHFHALVELPVSDEMGTCGGPLLATIQGANMFVGISCALSSGDRDKLGVVHITPDDIERYVPTFHSAGGFDYITEGKPLGDPIHLHSKSILSHNTVDGRGLPVCSFNGRRKNPKSNTKTSPIADVVISHLGGSISHAAPKMRGQLVDGEWKDPMLIGLKKRIDTTSRHDPHVLEDVIDSLVDDLWDNIDGTNLCRVDQDVALNGIDGYKHVDAIDKSTSGGFRFPGAKSKYLELDEETKKVVPKPEVMRWVDYIENAYKRGERANVLFDANLKDEALPIAKVQAFKTRLFTASALDFTIVVRKQFVKLAAELMLNGMETGIAAGMDAMTRWTELYAKLDKFGTAQTRCSAGDYSGFDTGMSPQRIMAGMEVLIRLNMRSGNFDEDDEEIMRGITADLAHPLVNFNGDVAMLYGTNCSGHPLTLILNSIVNLLDIRYCYHIATKNNPRNFTNDVVVFVMGDDNIFAVRDGVDFGHSTLTDELSKLDIKYTMADKVSETREHSSIRDMDFLKREFRFDEEHPGVCIAALDRMSIFKMLTTYTESKSVPVEHQLGSIVATANREAVLHGRAWYAKYHVMLEDVIQKFPSIAPWVDRSFTHSYERLFDRIVFGKKHEDDDEKVEYTMFAASRREEREASAGAQLLNFFAIMIIRMVLFFIYYYLFIYACIACTFVFSRIFLGPHANDDGTRNYYFWWEQPGPVKPSVKREEYMEACKMFDLPPDHTKQDLQKAFRKAAFDKHPDRGGSTEEFQQLGAARDYICIARGWDP